MPRCAALCLSASAWLALSACSSPTGPAAPDEHAADRANLLAQSEKFEAELAKRGLLYTDPELASYLAGVVAPLAAQSPGDPARYRVAVLRDAQPNAFALPNGAIYLNTGALVTVEDESQLALLVAHEMNHVALDHSLRGLTDRRSKTIAAKVTEVALGPLLGLTNLGFAAAIAGYSRDLEEEADHGGMEWLARAGFSAESAPRLFAALNTAQSLPGGGIWSDHPSNDARGAYCAELVASGRVAANPGGRNDVERLQRATERAALESLRLRLASRQYEPARAEVQRALSRYGESATLRYYEGESALRLIELPKGPPPPPASELGPSDVREQTRRRADRRVYDDKAAAADAKLADAERSFRRALELDGAHGGARRGLAEVQLRRGDRAGAEATLLEYLEANPGAPDERLVQAMLRRIRASAPADTKGEP